MGKKKKTVKKEIRLCAKCRTSIYQGCRHLCNKDTLDRNTMLQTSDLMKERIAHEVLKKMIDEDSQSNEEKKSNEGLSQIKLRHKGRPAHYTVKAGKVKRKRRLSFNTILKGKIGASMTNNQTNTFLRFMRHDTGRDSMSSNVQKGLIQHNKLFDGEFCAENVMMQVPKQEIKTKRRQTANQVEDKAEPKQKRTLVFRYSPIVYCNNISTFIQKIMELRNHANVNNMWLKVGIDDGRGKLKINLSLIPKFQDGQEVDKKFLDKFKPSGVKKIEMLACAPVKETTYRFFI
jgi:hypothetical protein